MVDFFFYRKLEEAKYYSNGFRIKSRYHQRAGHRLIQIKFESRLPSTYRFGEFIFWVDATWIHMSGHMIRKAPAKQGVILLATCPNAWLLKYCADHSRNVEQDRVSRVGHPKSLIDLTSKARSLEYSEKYFSRSREALTAFMRLEGTSMTSTRFAKIYLRSQERYWLNAINFNYFSIISSHPKSLLINYRNGRKLPT